MRRDARNGKPRTELVGRERSRAQLQMILDDAESSLGGGRAFSIASATMRDHAIKAAALDQLFVIDKDYLPGSRVDDFIRDVMDLAEEVRGFYGG